jgi:hypothetical protein
VVVADESEELVESDLEDFDFLELPPLEEPEL